MEKRRLGKTGLNTSRVGMGGIPIQRPSLEDAVMIINRALDLGVNLIDTSIGYGNSEIIIGKGIAGRRDEVLLATKGSWNSKEISLAHIDYSLKRLGTDYIDLWQMHNIKDLDSLNQVISPGGSLEAATEALDAGKILHIGFSTHNIEVAMRGVETGLFETIMFPLNFIAREAADKLITCAEKHNVGFLGMKPFAGGNITNARLALGYTLQYENVIPVPGIEKLAEIDEIVNLVNNGIELSDYDWAQMDEIRDQLGNRFCRQCMYCMPCPQGVEIWLLAYMKNLFRLWPKEQVIKMFGKAAETATKCRKCGECEEKCPYGLPIRELIDENYAYYLNELKKNDIR